MRMVSYHFLGDTFYLNTVVREKMSKLTLALWIRYSLLDGVEVPIKLIKLRLSGSSSTWVSSSRSLYLFFNG